jgi:hypothetical protein
MKVVEIEDVRAQVAQRAFGLLAHELRIVGMVCRSLDVAELRREKDLIARHVIPHLANQLLGMPVAVRIGRVPMRDARAMCGDERFLRLRVVVACPADGLAAVGHAGSAVSPRSEADGGDGDVGAAEADHAHGGGL